MKLENRATKLYLKTLAPLQAIKLIEEYRIPSPYKEVKVHIMTSEHSIEKY